jgi:hypothetical protein
LDLIQNGVEKYKGVAILAGAPVDGDYLHTPSPFCFLSGLAWPLGIECREKAGAGKMAQVGLNDSSGPS